MSRSRWTLVVWTLAVCHALGTSSVRAHSGNSGARVDQRTSVTIDEAGISIDYTTEFSRKAAYLEVLKMDLNGDGEMSRAEQDRYFDALQRVLVAGLELNVDGRELPLQPLEPVQLSMPFRKRYRFKVSHPIGWRDGAVVEFHNDNYLDFPGAITLSIDPGNAADIVYDSRWMNAEETLVPVERDVVFRYRSGTGKNEPIDTSTETLTDFAAVDVDVHDGVFPQHDTRFVIWLLGAVVVGLIALVMQRASLAIALSIGLVACAGLWHFAIRPGPTEVRVAMPSSVEAVGIFQSLHQKIYEAFRASTENEIYDTLASGLDGEILDEVYNEVYEARRIRTGGTTQFDVRRVKPIASEFLPATDSDRPAFRVRYRWRVYGTVTHFRHTHARFNEYEAVYRIEHQAPLRAWRITGTQLRQNKRVSIGDDSV